MLISARSAVALGLALALVSLAGCSSDGDTTAASESLIPVDQDQPGGVEADLAQARGLQPVLEKPRRYPFTIAVAPLLIEFGKNQVRFDTDLKDPLPIMPPERIAKLTQAEGWPADRDWPEEERAILTVLRDGFAGALAQLEAEGSAPGAAPAKDGAKDGAAPAKGGAAPAKDGAKPGPAPAKDGAKPGATPANDGTTSPEDKQAEGQDPDTEQVRGLRERILTLIQARGLACPPEGEGAPSGPDASAQAAPVGTSSLSFRAPKGWASIAPPVSGTLVAAYRAPDGTATVNAFYRPLSAFLSADELPLVRSDELLDRFTEGDLGRGTLVERVMHSGWIEVGGFPAISARADLVSGHEAHTFAILGADRQYVLTVIAPPGRFDLAEEILATVKLTGGPVAVAEQAPSAATRKKGVDLTDVQRSEIDELSGQNFGIRPEGFQERMVALLDQFGLFEEAEPLKLTDAQLADMAQLNDTSGPRNKALRQADARGADLLMVSRLRRNKISYAGISSFGTYVADAGLTFLFWFPNFAPGFRSENYRSDIELAVEVYDVRSGAQVWTYTYRRNRIKALKATERGWLGGFGILLMRFFRTDGQIDNARTYVRPQTWLEVEHDLLLDLWSPQAFKGELDDSGFEAKVNQGVVARRTALVAGISRYGPRAQPVLSKLAQQAAVAGLSAPVRDRLAIQFGAGKGESELLLANLRASYDEPSLDFGVRPYGESDATDIEEFLVNDGGFNRGFVKLLQGAAATRVQLKAALRWLAKARRDDPVFGYLNLETLVVDDPSQPGDKLRKYLLPYDADLVTLEEIMASSSGAERTARVLEHLERTAISFAWLEKTLNVEGQADDHRYLQSREVFLVLDCAFPGQYTGLRYAPQHAADVALGWNPSAGPAPGTVGGGTIEVVPEKTPDETPGETPDETPDETPGETPGETPQPPTPGVESIDPQPPADEWGPRNPFGPRGPEERRVVPEGPSGPRPGEQRRMISRSRLAPTTVLAQAEKEGEAEQEGEGKPPSGEQNAVRAPQLTDQFVRRLSRVPGRTVVVTGRFNDSLLDIVPQKRGAFAHHFLKGGNLRNRRVETQQKDGVEVLESRPLLEYIRTRVEDESRLLNRPQSILIYGDNDDFPLIERRK